MQITAKTSGSSGTVLGLNGRLVLGANRVEFRNAVREAALKHPSRIVLDLAQVTDVDFSSVGELVEAFNHARHQGSRLALANLPRRVRILLDTAKLTPIFEVSDSKPATIAGSGQQVRQHQAFC
jgi:anti-anti-sigma factor